MNKGFGTDSKLKLDSQKINIPSPNAYNTYLPTSNTGVKLGKSAKFLKYKEDVPGVGYYLNKQIF